MVVGSLPLGPHWPGHIPWLPSVLRSSLGTFCLHASRVHPALSILSSLSPLCPFLGGLQVSPRWVSGEPWHGFLWELRHSPPSPSSPPLGNSCPSFLLPTNPTAAALPVHHAASKHCQAQGPGSQTLSEARPHSLTSQSRGKGPRQLSQGRVFPAKGLLAGHFGTFLSPSPTQVPSSISL